MHEEVEPGEEDGDDAAAPGGSLPSHDEWGDEDAAADVERPLDAVQRLRQVVQPLPVLTFFYQSSFMEQGGTCWAIWRSSLAKLKRRKAAMMPSAAKPPLFNFDGVTLLQLAQTEAVSLWGVSAGSSTH